MPSKRLKSLLKTIFQIINIFELFKEGFSVGKIVKLKNISEKTTFDHLLQYYKDPFMDYKKFMTQSRKRQWMFLLKMDLMQQLNICWNLVEMIMLE